MSKQDQRSKHQQPKHAKPQPPSAPRAPVLTPPAVPPAPPTQAEIEARDVPPAAETRPVTDSLATEDLPPLSEAQKQEDAALLQKGLDDEAAGKAIPVLRTPVVVEDVVLIHNTTSSLHGIAIPAQPGVKRHQATHPMVTLLPGVNPVSRVDWDQAKAQVMVKIHLSEGNYVELESKSLAELNDKKAMELVDLTVHRPLLLEWADREKRPRVVAALAAQLEKIAPTKPKAAEAEDEDDDQE